jgi:hypothetical protein
MTPGDPSSPGATDGTPTTAPFATASGRHRARYRRFAWALIAYGVVGLLLAVASLLLVARTLPTLESIDRQRIELVRWLDVTAGGIGDVERGASNAGTSLESAAASARSAAALSDDLSATMASMRDASGLSILGSRPFAGLTDDFDRVSGRAHALASSMTALAGSLDSNKADFAAVASDATALRMQVTELRDVVAGDGSTGLDGPVGRLVVVLVGLILWLTLPAVAGLAGGALWLRELDRPSAGST